MNGIYRVIFNHATQTWTAVSELAKGRKKTKSEKMVAVASVVSLVLASSGVYAATQILDGKLSRPSTEGGSVIIAETLSGDQNVIIGSRIVGNVTDSIQSVVIGNDILMQNGRGSIAIGGDDAFSARNLGTVAGQNFAAVAREAGGFDNAGYRKLKVTEAGAIGIGTFAVATGKGATAVGLGSTANVEGATSYGTLAFSTGTGSSAFGLASRAEGSNTLALGAGARATQAGSIAIGAGSVTTEGVAVTSQGTKYEIGGTTYDPLTNTDYDVNNVVSVGNATVKRQIQNVAPGQITETSTDAINGSQLYAITKGVQQIINNNYQTIQNNINNSGFHLKNNAGATVADVNKDDSLTFKNGTFTTATVNANREVAYNVVTQNINVANGVPTETGTAGLATAQTVATAIKNSGFNLQANGQNGSLIKAGDTVSINKGDNTDVVKTGNAITVHANKTEVTATESDIKLDTKVTGRTTAYNISLSDAVKEDIAKGVQALAAVEGRVFSFDGDNSTTTGEVSEGNITFAGGDNINTVASEENGRPTVTINLNSDITVDNVTVGSVKISKDDGINAGDKTITGVASGGDTGTNAANIDDVKRLAAAADTTASTSGTNGIEVVKTTVNGKTTDYQVGLTKATQDEIAKGQQALQAIAEGIYSFDGDNGSTTGNAPAGNISFTGSENIITTAKPANDSGYPEIEIALAPDITVDNVTVGTVKISKDGGINAGDKTITGVANAVNANDAVNLSQLNATKVSVVGGANITSVDTKVTDNGTTYTINAKDTSASVSNVQGSPVSVTKGTEKDGVTDYVVDLTTEAKASLEKANTAVQSVTGKDGIVATTENNAVTVGLTPESKASLQKADSAIQEIKTTVNGQAVKTLNQADNTQDFKNGTNIDITTEDGKIIVATKPNVEFTSVSTNTLDAKIGTITDLTSVKMTTGSITATTASVDNLVADNANVGILLTRDSATIGGLLTANGGLAVASNQRIDMGDNQVHNVKAGTADTDAVNVSQLKANTTTVAAGKNITSVNEVRDANGIHYTIDGKDTTVSNAQGSPVSVTKGTEQDGVTDYVVDLTAEAKTSLEKANTAVQNVTGKDGITAEKQGDTVTVGLTPESQASLQKADSAIQEIKTTVNGQAVKTLTKDDNIQDFENGKNIDITTKDGKIIVATKDSVTFTDVKTGTLSTTGDATIGGNMATTGTATIGGMLNANGGLTVANGQTVQMGNNRVQGVANAVESTDAVNLSQLNATKVSVVGGANITSVDSKVTDNGTIYTINAKDTSATVSSANDKALKVTQGTPNNGITDFALELGDDTKASLAKADTAVQNVTGKDGITAEKQGDTVTVGLTPESQASLKLADSSVQSIVNKVNGQAVNTLTKNANEQDFVNGDNIEISNDNGAIKVATAKTVAFDKVTVGTASIDKDAGINAGNKTIKGVANATANDEAVNLAQLKAQSVTVKAGQNVNSVNEVKTDDGITYTIDAKDTTVSKGSDAVTVEKGTETNGVTDYKVDLSADTKASLAKADSAVQEIETQIDGKTVKTVKKDDNTANFITGDNIELTDENGAIKVATKKDVTFTNVNTNTLTATTGTIGTLTSTTINNTGAINTQTLTTTGDATIGGMLNANGGLTVANGQTVQMGNNRIQGVANAVESTDAVNLSQLNATKVSVVGGANITSIDTKVTDNGTTYTINAKDTSATVSSANEKALKVTQGAENNGITDFALELGDDTKASLAKADTAVQNVTGKDGITAEKQGDTVTVGLDEATKANLTKADTAVQEIKTTVNGQAVKTLTKDNNTQDFVNGDNIVISDDNGAIKVSTAKEVTFDKVTVGTASIDKDAGINAGNKTIKGVANATANDEAVNLAQLKAQSVTVKAGQNVNSVNEVKTDDGITYTIDAKDTTVSKGSNAVTVEKGTETNGVTDYKVDLSTDTKASLTKADTAVQEIETQIDGKTVKTVKKDDNTANFITGDNIELTDENGAIKVATKKDVTFDKVNSTVIEAVDARINNVQADDIVTLDLTSTHANINTLESHQIRAGDIKASTGTITDLTSNHITANSIDARSVDVISLTAKDTKTDTLATTGNAQIGGKLTVQNGIDATNNRIENVANATRNSDAVNLAQLKANTTTVVAGANITSVDKVADENGVTYTINAKDTSATVSSANDKALKVTQGTPNNGITDFALELGDDTKASLAKADSSVQSIVNKVNGQAVNTLTKNANEQDFVNGDNIEITNDNGAIKVATKQNVSFTDVKTDTLTTTGTATIGGMLNANGGLTVANGQTVQMGNNRVQGVADGTADTDAVNVSQLRNNVTTLNNNIDAAKTELTAKGLDFSGNTGETHRDLGTKLAITGEATTQGNYSGANLKTVVTATGVALQFADNPEFKDIKADSIKTGDNVLNGTGLTIGTASITNADGINAGNKTIKGVANATANDEAVNLAQLKAQSVTVKAGQNVNSVNEVKTDDGITYTIDAKDTTVSKGSDAVTVEKGTETNGVTDYKVDLSADTKASLAKADTAVQNVTGKDGITAEKQGDTVTVGLDEATKANLTKADTAVQEIKTTVNGQAVKTLTKDNNTQDFVNGDNIVISDDNGAIKVSTAKEVTFDKVTVGTASIDKDAGINAGNKTIQGVANATKDDEAVNLSQLNATKNTINTEIAKGLNFSADSGDTVNRKLGQTLSITGGNGQGDYSTTNVRTVTTADGVRIELADNPTFKNVKASDVQTATLTTTGTATIGGMLNANGGLTIANGQTVQMGNNRVQGVANAVESTDAVNLSQLNATKVSVVGGANITSVDSKVTDNGTTYTINAKDTSATVSSANDKALKVTQGTPNNGITDFALDLGDDTKASLEKADTAVQNVQGQGGITATKGADNVVTVDLDEATKANLTKADAAVQEIETQIDGKTVKTVKKGDNTANFITGDNIELTDENGAIKVATKKDVTFTNVNTDTLTATTGTIGTLTSTTINNAGAINTQTLATSGTATIGGMLNANGGLTVANGQTVNMGNNTISNVASGGDVGTNAANIDDVKRLAKSADTTASTSGTNGIEVLKVEQNGQVTDYQVGLTQATRDDIAKGVQASDDVANKGLTFTGDTGTTTAKKLGDSLAITGDDNISTTATANGVAISLNRNLTADSLSIGNVVINNAGINAGNQVISNVANGVADTDAVNVAQLKANSVKVVAGANITSVESQVTPNGTTYTINAKDTSASVSAASNALTVKAGEQNNGVIDYAIDLSDDIKASLNKADTAVQNITTKVNGKAVKTLNQADNSQDFVDGDNITITNDNGAIKVATKKDVSFTDVKTGTLTTTGDTTVGGTLTANGGLTVANGQAVNLGNNRVQGVANGVENSDAVNVAQLNNATTILNQAINAAGWTLKANGDSGEKIANNGEVNVKQGKNIQVKREGSTLTIQTVDNPNFTTVTANNVETKDLNAIGNITLGGENGQVSVANGTKVDLGNNVINGVADGDISPNSKQAVNGGQVAKLISGEATLSTPDVALSNGKTITQIVAIDSDGKAYTLTTYNAQGRGEVLNNSVISAIHNMNEQGIKFFHTNDGITQSEAQKTNSVDSQANGAYSTAVGYQASAEGTGALAIGQGAEVKGEGSVSIGAENSVNADNSGAVGRRNRINGIGSYVTGSNNRVDTQDTYVFGSGVTQTVANSVFLGNNSGYVEESRTTKGNQANEAQQIAGQTYYFAGGKAEEVVGVVSVGNVDERGVQQTRRIQNVAPGLISAESTDAVNGSQLHSVVSNLNQNLNAGYNALNRRIHTVDRHLRSGVAGAVATASLVQAYNPSDSLLAVGGGTYRGASALALGYSKVSDNGKVIFKLTGSVNNAGHYTGGASIGYRF